MKVSNLSTGATTYSCNAYLILGTWNALGDTNTLVDVGRDELLLKHLEQANTGVGKRRVEQVIITHAHYDHLSLLPKIEARYRPQIYAYSESVEGALRLYGGERLVLGDEEFEVVHTPAHSQDSICLVGVKCGALFCGDTPLRVRDCDGSYGETFVNALARLMQFDVQVIYPGHGPAITTGARALLEETYAAVSRSLATHADADAAGNSGRGREVR